MILPQPPEFWDYRQPHLVRGKNLKVTRSSKLMVVTVNFELHWRMSYGNVWLGIPSIKIFRSFFFRWSGKGPLKSVFHSPVSRGKVWIPLLVGSSARSRMETQHVLIYSILFFILYMGVSLCCPGWL
jgi:hypothetical protein